MEWHFGSSSELDAHRLRDEFVGQLRAHGTGDIGAAELVYGELIGNVVRHAPGRVTIRLEWGSRSPVLTVHDEAQPFEIRPSLPNDLFAESGRGLFIVDAFARDLRIEDIAGDGTAIHVVLPVDRRVDTAAGGEA